ncbi:hypothetical protein D3C81_1202120 [compost metagenome]
MADRFGQAVVPGEPAGAEAVQGPQVVLAALQAGAEKLAEQGVEAIPDGAVIGVDPIDQQVLVFHALDQIAG